MHQSHRPPVRELDVVARWLWLFWRVLLFCSLLSSPMPLSVPNGLLRLSQVLRSLRRAVPSIESQRAETPYPFRPDDGDMLRPGYEAKHGHQGRRLVEQLGGHPGYPAPRPGRGPGPEVDFAGLLTDSPSPKAYLSPPAPHRQTSL